MVVLLTAIVLANSSRVEAAEPRPDRWARLDPRPPNQFSFRATTLGNFAGVDIGYRRGIGNHISLGVALEYIYPDAGYGHLQAFGHTVEVIGWIARPWYGPYFAASMTLGHGFASPIPELDMLALGGGLAFGYSWDLPFGFNLGISGGLRRMEILERDGQICTLPGHCVFANEDFRPRFELTFGYRF